MSVSYFFDDESAGHTEKRLGELAAWRDAGLTQQDPQSPEHAGVTGVALRAVGLSARGLEFAKVILDQLREMEGLEPEKDGSPRGGSKHGT